VEVVARGEDGIMSFDSLRSNHFRLTVDTLEMLDNLQLFVHPGEEAGRCHPFCTPPNTEIQLQMRDHLLSPRELSSLPRTSVVDNIGWAPSFSEAGY